MNPFCTHTTGAVTDRSVAMRSRYLLALALCFTITACSHPAKSRLSQDIRRANQPASTVEQTLIDQTSGAAIPYLPRVCILTQFQTSDGIESPHPSAIVWHRLLATRQALTHYVSALELTKALPQSDLLIITGECDLDPEDLRLILEYLSNGGRVVFCEDWLRHSRTMYLNAAREFEHELGITLKWNVPSAGEGKVYGKAFLHGGTPLTCGIPPGFMLEMQPSLKRVGGVIHRSDRIFPAADWYQLHPANAYPYHPWSNQVALAFGSLEAGRFAWLGFTPDDVASANLEQPLRWHRLVDNILAWCEGWPTVDARFWPESYQAAAQLSFSCDRDTNATQRLLNLLGEKQIDEATFFVVGEYVARNDFLLHAMSARGELGVSGSWSLPGLTPMHQQSVISLYRDAIYDVCSRLDPPLRPVLKGYLPNRTDLDQSTLRALGQLGFSYCVTTWMHPMSYPITQTPPLPSVIPSLPSPDYQVVEVARHNTEELFYEYASRDMQNILAAEGFYHFIGSPGRISSLELRGAFSSLLDDLQQGDVWLARGSKIDEWVRTRSALRTTLVPPDNSHPEEWRIRIINQSDLPTPMFELELFIPRRTAAPLYAAIETAHSQEAAPDSQTIPNPPQLQLTELNDNSQSAPAPAIPASTSAEDLLLRTRTAPFGLRIAMAPLPPHSQRLLSLNLKSGSLKTLETTTVSGSQFEPPEMTPPLIPAGELETLQQELRSLEPLEDRRPGGQ